MIYNQKTILEEYSKFVIDIKYLIEKYFTVDYKEKGGVQPFILFPRQRQLIDTYVNERLVVVLKYRQAGVSTVTAAYIAAKYALASDSNPMTCVILANKESTAKKMLKNIKGFLLQVPRFVWGDEFYGNVVAERKKLFLIENEGRLVLPNKSEIVALATSPDCFRTYSPTDICVDETAYVEKDPEETFAAGMASLGATQGKCYLISTPNGRGEPVFWKTYSQAKSKENNFVAVDLWWWEDPRYNKDLIWIKTGEDGKDIIIEEKEFSENSYKEKLQNGYKASSSWFRNMSKDLNNNQIKISQELLCDFIGSGNDAISAEAITYYESKSENIEELCKKGEAWIDGKRKEVWKYKEPITGHKYISVSDVSRGDAQDFSTILIVDTSTTPIEVVLEYKGKVASNILGEMIYEYALPYNALAVVDSTGGWGNACLIKLLDLKYPQIYYSSPIENPNINEKELYKYAKNDSNRSTPGFSIQGSNRASVIDAGIEFLEERKIVSKSIRLVNEMKSWIYKNNKITHLKGCNDDLLISLSIACFVYQYCLRNVEKLQEQQKAMLSAWIRNPEEKKIDNTPSIKKPPAYFGTIRNMQDPNGEFLWLWGKPG